MHKSILALVAAAGLAGCASFSEHPEFKGLTKISALPEGGAGTGRIMAELERAVTVGDAYLAAGQSLMKESGYTGVGVLGFGVYGAGVTAFNPAPKNLLAALVGGGTAQAWRTGLKPAERSKVYVQGYRALDCLSSAGSVLLVGAESSAAGVVKGRSGIVAMGDLARQARSAAEKNTNPSPNRTALLLRLDAVEKGMATLDAALKLEQNALADAPYRIAQVRRQIESDVDSKINGMAPDYEAALKILKDSSSLPNAGAEAKSEGEAEAKGVGPQGANSTQPNPANLEATVLHLENGLASLIAEAPTLATDAYENMGQCVKVAQ